MAYEPHTSWYLPENVQTGLCLETVLDALVDSESTCVDNQPQCTHYKEGAPQAIRMEWDGDDRSPELPCNFMTYGLSVHINPEFPPLQHPVIYKRIRIEKEKNLMTEVFYEVPNIIAFRNLLYQLKQGRKEVLGLLSITNFEEYDLRGLQESLGLPKNLYDMAERLSDEADA